MAKMKKEGGSRKWREKFGCKNGERKYCEMYIEKVELDVEKETR